MQAVYDIMHAHTLPSHGAFTFVLSCFVISLHRQWSQFRLKHTVDLWFGKTQNKTLENDREGQGKKKTKLNFL